MRPDTIINESRQFNPRQFFYSRTDHRGVIKGGNRLFFEVSGYDADALIGAPHKVVRHPDMPRGVFHLFWQTIKANRPMGAFVKNLASDGRYYWVLATVLPLDDGYISVRLGAQGPLFEKTQAIYARMLRAEADGMTPDRSAEMLLRELSAAGYASYEDYFAELLMQHMGDAQHAGTEAARLGALHKSLVSVTQARTALTDTLRTLYLIPTNMRILASRLEPSGGPVSAISDSYKRAAAELMARLNSAGEKTGQPGSGEKGALVSTALIPVAISGLLRLAAAQLASGPEVPGIDACHENRIITDLAANLEAASAKSTERMMQSARHISREAEHIKRLMAGLDQIRILGEVESGRLRNADGGLAAIMAQLSSFHDLIHTRLAVMSNVAARMQSGMS